MLCQKQHCLHPYNQGLFVGLWHSLSNLVLSTAAITGPQENTPVYIDLKEGTSENKRLLLSQAHWKAHGILLQKDEKI
jgi:hypothetical protein